VTGLPRESIYVKWIDSNGAGGWHHLDELKREPHAAAVETVGWLIDEDYSELRLSLNRVSTEPEDGTAPFGSVIAIPKVAIINRFTIRLPRPS
jgi:hypothetical protein